MDFKDNILQLAERIKKQKDAIQTEEATKNAFIMPIITALGYDVFNPFEVVPEMDCDLTRKGDKIDYAIKKDGRTILLIECKHCKQNLDLHNTQLSKYYAASNARFGVLTNGIEYRFYADLDKTNIMDEKPFLVVNMLDLSDADIEEMKKFHKSCYNESEILSTAKELQMMIQIKEILAKNFQSPGDEFTRYFVRSLNNGKSTPKLIEEYRPIVRKSILSVIGGMISGRPATAIQVKEEKPRQAPNDGMAAISDKQDAVITCKETDAYNIIRAVLGEQSEISYTSFKGYLLIWTGHEYWWVCRVSLRPYSKRICFVTENRTGYKWIQLQSIEDIRNYSNEIRTAFEIACKQRKQYQLKHKKS
ncbi:type I restriction endonuclease [Phocaeicola vulgatus]|uniref:type I restriction endonuclease n=1 Tax=Phocaeicola vulgatus TaxID=821 RepID=UPI001E3AD0CF|nr:type I restriction endonuclease [Phocaeicola vulgatus]BDC07197.1 hypothetical protein GAIMETA21S03_30800 [Phocaeicola vulgatus]